jgi:hypothetical protein
MIIKLKLYFENFNDQKKLKENKLKFWTKSCKHIATPIKPP